MTNHSARGRASENAVRDELGSYGYDVMRSAGSKGAADLIAIGDGFAVLVQVKLGAHGKPFMMPSPAERVQLLRLAERLGNAVAVAACRVPGAGSRPAVTAYRVLIPPGGPYDFAGWSPGQGPPIHIRATSGPVTIQVPPPREPDPVIVPVHGEPWVQS